MHSHRHGAKVPGLAAPEPAELTPHKEEAPGATAEGFRGQGAADSPDCAKTHHAGQALRVIEGERQAAQYLARLQAEQADPDELALIVAMLYGATLRGFCRVIVKALGVRHG